MEEIYLLSDTELEKKYSFSAEGAAVSCIKHIRRYGIQVLPKELWLKLLFYSLKGMHCKDDHLCISQRLSIYEFLKDKEITDPFIKQFIEETEEKHKHALL